MKGLEHVEQTSLFDRIYAAMLAGAIGDAMGGPIEGWHYERIGNTYGVLDRFLAYDFPPDHHNHFATAPGTVTDDTRLKHLVAQTIIAADSPCWRGAQPRRGDFVWSVLRAYQNATTELERGFLEEYALGGAYGEEKLIWGGQMTNGFLMANAPIGLICPCDPEAAFALSFDVDFISDGYARYTAAMGAAAVAAAMGPQATPETIVEAVLKAAGGHRVEGPLTQGWRWYDDVFRLNERLLTTAVEIALRHRDILSLRAEYYDRLQVGPLGSEAAQTLAVALGLLVAAEGDLTQAIVGAVNYGRDNDSYATLVGAVAGALRGTSAIPQGWRGTVEAANPEPDMRALSVDLAKVVFLQHQRQQQLSQSVDMLLH